MLGWRRRKDGFEWREYVRTTILVRRKNRRDRIVRASNAAVDGLKVAGERGVAAGAVGAQAVGRAAMVAGEQGLAMGVAGANVLGRKAKDAGRQGLEMGAVGLRVADDRIRAGLPALWDALQTFAAKVLAALGALAVFIAAAAVRIGEISAPTIVSTWERLQPFFAWVRKPGVTTVLALVAAVALIGSFRRIAANGWSGDLVIALLIGAIVACILLAAWLARGVPEWLAAGLRGTGRGVGGLAAAATAAAPSRASLARSGGIAVLLALVVGAGWLVWRAAAALPSLVASETLEGRAVALSGDSVRVAKTTVVLAGIEAPVDGQVCRSESGRPWRCDTAAKLALAHLLRSGAVACELSGSDDQGRRVGTCRQGETDIAAELVRNGDVFSDTGFLSSYGSLESEARAAKAGIWRGEAVRPSDYRAQKWEEAKREAPEGCPIKGNVSRGQRVYVLPWAQDYERVKISSRRGERWFCSEDEALAAGWKPSGQS
jgi:endonuclease YncB( thermonuclease family)